MTVFTCQVCGNPRSNLTCNSCEQTRLLREKSDSSGDAIGGSLILIGLVASVIYFFWKLIERPDQLEFPSIVFAYFYHFVLYIPLSVTFAISKVAWESLSNITAHSNLNFVLSLLGGATIWGVLCAGIYMVSRKVGPTRLFYFYAVPCGVWIVEAVVGLVLDWLLKAS